MRKILWMIFPIFLILFPILIIGCLDLPSKIIAPSWDTNINISMINRDYTINDLIKNPNYISAQQIGGRGIYLLQSDPYSQSFDISKFMQASGFSSLDTTLQILNTSSTTLYLQFPDSVQLDSAIFIGGIFSFQFINYNSDTVIFTLTIPGLLMGNRSPFSVQVVAAPNKTDSLSFNLAGDSYKIPLNQPSSLKGYLGLMITSKVIHPSIVKLGFKSSNFSFSYVSGNLRAKSLGDKKQIFSLSLGNAKNFRDATFLRSAELNFNVNYLSIFNNFIGIEVRNLSINGKRNDGKTISLIDSTGNSNFDFIFSNGSYNYQFTNLNSNITQFISFLPDSIIITAEYVLNPNNQSGTVSFLDAIRFETDFSTLSFIAFKNVSITDTTKIDISKSDRINISNGKLANILLLVQNGIPLESWVKLILTDSLYNPIDTIKEASGNDSIYFNAAAINQSGEVTNPAMSANNIVLDSMQIIKLSQAYYLISIITIASPNSNLNPPQTVAIRPDEEIKISAVGTVKYQIDPNQKY